MDSISSNCDEADDLGSRLSSSVDHSFTEIRSTSILSGDSFAYCRTDSETSAFSGVADEISSTETASPLFWKGLKSPAGTALSRFSVRKHNSGILDDDIQDLDLELMKERFAKLLLGEDMSGSGKGESTAVTISNATTNLYASIFGQHQRLEPLNLEKKLMWKREMSCLLSVCDHIVEFSPTLQNLKDGTTLEVKFIHFLDHFLSFSKSRKGCLQVMTSRPRPDIYINLPALKKLDAMLLDILDSFEGTEFWYADQGSISENSTHSGSFRRILQPLPQRKEKKWWLPVPCIPPEGLSEKSKKHLRQRRDFANQIHKAAMAINTGILAEMQVPEPYLDSLPKSGKASIGDTVYYYMYNTRKFSADHLLDSIGINSEREALELADKIEASMYTWRRKMWMAQSKSSWGVVKDLVSDIDRCDKNHLLADRANTLLLSLKQRYPELSQTTLDSSKIQYNKDIGQAVLESYSRVIESLAFNIVASIEDVLYVDHETMTKQEPGT